MHLDAAWTQAGLVAKVGRMNEIKVLDHGFVKFVDSMGSDERIVEAARVSTGRGFVSWEPYKRCKRCNRVGHFEDAQGGLLDLVSNTGWPCLDTDPVSERYSKHGPFEPFPRGDLGILEYLYKNGHTTPFEMCELVIDVQAPMDVWRQWIRNRTASVNEYSTRYSPAIDLMASTSPREWRKQGTTNRQGSGEFLPPWGEEIVLKRNAAGEAIESDFTPIGAKLTQRELELHQLAREVYEERLAMGVAKEQARKDLPLSNYTRAIWKMDLHNLLHNFLGKRMHPHAQLEIRQYANAVAQIAKEIWPRTYALFEEYTLHGVHLSRTEARAALQSLELDPTAAPALVIKLRGA